MPIITISRQYGTGGRPLSRMIAKKLNYQLIDSIVIEEIAKKANVTKSSVKAIEREAGGWISKIIGSSLSRDYMERLVGDKGYLDENIYGEILPGVIRELAERDNMVFLGRGGQYFLRDYKNTFHFLLIADKADRIKFMQQFYHLSDEKAYHYIIDGDQRRAKFFKRFGRSNYNDPVLYHMVLNMSRISLDQALEQICTLVLK